jgi:hypothetical protein
MVRRVISCEYLLLLALLIWGMFLCGCAPQPVQKAPPPAVAEPPLAQSMASAMPPPDEPPPDKDEDGVMTAVDVDPAPAGFSTIDKQHETWFDTAAWLAERGVTEPVPEAKRCLGALPPAPGRPEMLLCKGFELAYEGPSRFLYHQIGHIFVFAVDGMKLKKVLDVIDMVRPWNKVSMHPIPFTFNFNVIVTADGGEIVLADDRPNANCAKTLAKDNRTSPTPAKDAALKRFYEKVCTYPGRYVFTKDRFVQQR